jgi:ribosomal protein S6
MLINLLSHHSMKKELELYELVLLLKFTTTEQETISKTEFYRNFLIEKGSQVLVKNQGKVPLAYPIKGFDIATSVQLIFLGNGTLLNQINVEIQRDETVLRAITTKLINQPPVEMLIAK